MAGSEISSGAYLKWEALESLLQQRLGPEATRPRMAEFLGVRYLTLWRLTKVHGDGHRFRAKPETVKAILARLNATRPDCQPEVTFGDLFEGVEPRAKVSAPPRRAEVEPMFSVLEVSHAWGVSVDQIYRLIHSGQLGHKDVSTVDGVKNKLRVPKSAIDAYLSTPTKKRKVEPVPGSAGRYPVRQHRAA